MAGFSNELLASLSVQKVAGQRTVTCPKCGEVIYRSMPGASVSQREHADLMDHYRRCLGPKKSSAQKKDQ